MENGGSDSDGFSAVLRCVWGFVDANGQIRHHNEWFPRLQNNIPEAQGALEQGFSTLE